MSKKLDELLKKREQLNARIQKERNKQSQQKRKEDTLAEDSRRCFDDEHDEKRRVKLQKDSQKVR